MSKINQSFWCHYCKLLLIHLQSSTCNVPVVWFKRASFTLHRLQTYTSFQVKPINTSQFLCSTWIPETLYTILWILLMSILQFYLFFTLHSFNVSQVSWMLAFLQPNDTCTLHTEYFPCSEMRQCVLSFIKPRVTHVTGKDSGQSKYTETFYNDDQGYWH